MTGVFASRLCGSADLYQRSGKEPINSMNFVTCHDGFTLNDAVSYAAKAAHEPTDDQALRPDEGEARARRGRAD
jgi:pullulanase/glycogen debranching enzyme